VKILELQQLQAAHMQTLARLMVRAYCENNRESSPEDLAALKKDLQYVSGLGLADRASFLGLANSNHVVMRALSILKNAAALLNNHQIEQWCETALSAEGERVEHALNTLASICEALEAHNCRVTVIKSLDHWPDLGSDLDLYTTADAGDVERVMQQSFGASPVERSWGDRLANKWNYQVPGLPELVEIHVQFLGQTGEHTGMARRVIDRRMRKNVGGHDFYVPAPEERIVISTLQRVYRHFYYRLCDMIDVAVLLRSDPMNFTELHRAADVAGIWPGVATFLVLIQNFVRSYGGEIVLPEEVLAAAHAREQGVRFGNGFLRVSKVTAAGLYGAQVMQAGLRRDMRALMRLPLLPPLAFTALVAHSLTGNDKGIW
jgi:hypothetical protein